MTRALMVDLETLSTELDATILTLGAVIFDPYTNTKMDELYLRIDVDSQDVLGGHVSESTLEWWGKQDPAIMEEAFDPTDRITIQEAIHQFHQFAWNSDEFWSNGASFDLMIIQMWYKKLNKPVPWQYWQIRDCRTLYALADAAMPKGALHNALEDAKRQAIGVRNVYAALNFTGKKLT